MNKETANRVADTLSNIVKDKKSGCCNAPITYRIRAGKSAFGQRHFPKRVCSKCDKSVEYYWGEYDQEAFQETGDTDR